MVRQRDSDGSGNRIVGCTSCWVGLCESFPCLRRVSISISVSISICISVSICRANTPGDRSPVYEHLSPGVLAMHTDLHIDINTDMDEDHADDDDDNEDDIARASTAPSEALERASRPTHHRQLQCRSCD